MGYSIYSEKIRVQYHNVEKETLIRIRMRVRVREVVIHIRMNWFLFDGIRRVCGLYVILNSRMK